MERFKSETFSLTCICFAFAIAVWISFGEILFWGAEKNIPTFKPYFLLKATLVAMDTDLPLPLFPYFTDNVCW